MDLSTELSTDASTDLPSVLYQNERIEDLRMSQEVLKEPEDETSDENIELEDDPEDEIKATFDRRLKILKRACSVLPQLRGANDLASHNQLIRKGFNRAGFLDRSLMPRTHYNREKNSRINSRCGGEEIGT